MTKSMKGIAILDIKTGAPLPTTNVIRAVRVTPDLAQDWLNRFSDVDRRRIRSVIVDGYANDMAAGKWVDLKGEIEFTEDNGHGPILSDGNHRMHAIVKSSKPQWMKVTFSASEDVRRVEGNRLNRTPADSLRMEGLKTHIHATTAIVKQHWVYEMTVGDAIPWRRVMSDATSRPDADDIIEHWESAPMLFDAAVRAVQNVRADVPQGLPPKALGTFVAEAERLHPGEGVAYLKTVMKGGGPLANGKTTHVTLTNIIQKGPLDLDRLVVETLVRGFNADQKGKQTFHRPVNSPSRPFVLSPIR